MGKTIFSFGVAKIRVMPHNKSAETDLITLNEQVDGTDTTLTGERDIAELFSKGKNGPVMSRENRTTTTLVGTYFLDFETLAGLFPDNVVSDSGGFNVKSTLSREILPVKVDIRPLGDDSMEQCIYIPNARLSFNENFGYDTDVASQVEITMQISDDDTGVLYSLGKEIPVTPPAGL